MAFSYGFYNSLDHDRVYDAEQVSSIFDGIIGDGIFMSIGEKFMVKAAGDMQFTVGSGRAWFDHTWSLNTAKLTFTLPPADALLNQIYLVILRVDHRESERKNTITYKASTPATNPVVPTLTKTELTKEYPLAEIYVGKGVTAITQANITNKIGTSECPFVTGIIDTMDIDDLVDQWGTQWQEWFASTQSQQLQWTTEQRTAFIEWMNAQQADFENYISEFESGMDDFQSANEGEFNEWFDNVKDQLSEDAAGNLQNQIDNLDKDIEYLDFGMIDGLTQVTIHKSGSQTIITEEVGGREELSSSASANILDKFVGIKTTTIQKSSGDTMIATDISPKDGQWDYHIEQMISKQSNGDTIVSLVDSQKIPKS